MVNTKEEKNCKEISAFVHVKKAQQKENFLSFLSLSLSFNYLVPISAGIARVVKVKLARAQGVHDDVEDTELTGG